jgi:hypothetical protein
MTRKQVTAAKEEIIRKAYYDPEVGYLGLQKLFHKLKDQGISKFRIRQFLAKQEVYQKTKKRYKNLDSFIPKYPHQEYQMDLIHIPNPHVNKASYGLSVIDIFTKKATVILLKKKDTKHILEAVQKAFEELGLPESVFSDEGSEFISKGFNDLMKKLNVKVIITYGHAPFVERFNRTIKEIMERYLEAKKTKDITSVLGKIVKNYNNTYHSSIGMTPNEVNEDNMHEAQINIIAQAKIGKKKDLKVGDTVRVQLKDQKLKKGYRVKFSENTYKIAKIDRPYYYVEGEKKPYLAVQLQKVKAVETHPEKYVSDRPKRRTRARAVEVEIPEAAVENRPERRKRNRYVKTDFGTVLIE